MKKNTFLIPLAVIGLLLLIFHEKSNGQSLYYPPVDGEWERVDISTLRWCPEAVDSLATFLAEHDTKAFIILVDGRIAIEEYFGEFTRDSFWYWASAGKSLAAFITGLAQEQGYLHIEDPVQQYLGEGWTSCAQEDEAGISIRHQLSMTTGFDERGVDLDCLSPECLKCLYEPGSRWYYHNAPYRLVQDVVAEATGQSFQRYTMSQLRSVTGISGLWLNYVFFSNARSMARFGLLMLAEGRWGPDRVMTDSVYFQSMIRSSQAFNKAYGYLWWLNGQDNFQLPGIPLSLPGTLISEAPADMYAALGRDDQKLYVVPSTGMVVVRLGRDAGSGAVPALSSFDNKLWTRINRLSCTPNASGAYKAEDFGAFPNPAHGVFSVKVPEGFSGHWRLLRTDGIESCRGALHSSKTEINCEVPRGLYLLQCFDSRGEIVYTSRQLLL